MAYFLDEQFTLASFTNAWNSIAENMTGSYILYISRDRKYATTSAPQISFFRNSFQMKIYVAVEQQDNFSKIRSRIVPNIATVYVAFAISVCVLFLGGLFLVFKLYSFLSVFLAITAAISLLCGAVLWGSKCKTIHAADLIVNEIKRGVVVE